MGSQLSYRKLPLLDIKTEQGSAACFDFVSSTITGWRRHQEDRLTVLPEFCHGFSFFAVYDGHGGSEVSEYLHQHFPQHLESYINEQQAELALHLAFHSFDNEIRNLTEKDREDLMDCDEESDDDGPDPCEIVSAFKAYSAASSSIEGAENPDEHIKRKIASVALKLLTKDDSENEEDKEISSSESEDVVSHTETSDETSDAEESPNEESDVPKPKVGYLCGSTATVVLLNNERVYVANVGDSRGVASINGCAVDLTIDHKPSDPEELVRINESGSKVTDDDRVDGGLNMSRAFGDFANKKTDSINEAIICDPYVMSLKVDNIDFIIVATDGIWNSMSSQEVVDYINIRMKYDKLCDICEEIIQFILAPDATGDGTGCDNMSIIIIDFKRGCEISNQSSKLVMDEQQIQDLKKMDGNPRKRLGKDTDEMPGNSKRWAHGQFK